MGPHWEGLGALLSSSPTASQTFGAGLEVLGGCPTGAELLLKQRLCDHLSFIWWSLGLLWSKCFRIPHASDPPHFRRGHVVVRKECWARMQKIRTLVSSLPPHWLRDIGQVTPLSRPQFAYLWKEEIGSNVFGDPFQFWHSRIFWNWEEQKNQIIITTKGIGVGVRGPPSLLAWSGKETMSFPGLPGLCG